MARERPLRISLTLSTTDDDLLIRAAEAFSRAGVGLALEGLPVMILWTEDEVDQSGG